MVWVLVAAAIAALVITVVAAIFTDALDTQMQDGVVTGFIATYFAVLVMLAVFGGFAYGVYGLVTGDEDAIVKDDGPDQSDCFPQAPASC